MGTRGPSVQSLGIGMERKTIGAAGPGPELTFVVRQSQKDFATALPDRALSRHPTKVKTTNLAQCSHGGGRAKRWFGKTATTAGDQG